MRNSLPEKRPRVVLLAFANGHEGRRLECLTTERKEIVTLLDKLDDSGLIKLVFLPDATLDDIKKDLLTYRDRLAVFHYAGHASPDALQLESQQGGAHNVDATGFAKLLAGGRAPDLVFLNGCSTQEQITALHNQGVKAVIGTTDDISDTSATDFAIDFYKMLVKPGKSPKEAFDWAENSFETDGDRQVMRRGARITGGELNKWPWVWRPRAQDEEHLRQWSLDNLQPKHKPQETPLLGYLCDRTEQVNQLVKKSLPTHQSTQPSRPLGFIVHGRSGEAHEDFFQRICEWDLPRYFASGALDLAHIELISIDWHNNVEKMQLELARETTNNEFASLLDIQQAIVEIRSPVIIKTSVAAAQWQNATAKVIRDWMSLFAGFGDMPSGQDLLVVVLIVEEPKFLEQILFWKTNAQKFVKTFQAPTHIEVQSLPELKSVHLEEAEEWLRSEFKSQLAECGDDLPKTSGQLIARLRPFVNDLYDETADKNKRLPMRVLGYKLDAKITDILEGA